MLMLKMISVGAVVVALCMVVSCSNGPLRAARASSPTGTQAGVVQGKIVFVSDGHGNVFTDIRPERYQALGLVAGRRVRVQFGQTELTLVVGVNYIDVPSGSPLAVLHREGLALAICDGNFSATYGVRVGTPFTLSLLRRGD